MNARIAKKIVAWPLYQMEGAKKGADNGTYPYTQAQFVEAVRVHYRSLRRSPPRRLKWATGCASRRTVKLVKRLGGDHLVQKPARTR